MQQFKKTWNNQSQKGGGKAGGKGGGKKSKIKDTSKALWVGNLPANTTFQQLLAFGKNAGNAKWAEIKSKGQGCIGFATAEEAQGALFSLNGGVLGGMQVQVDSWEKKTK